jgi:hypothetical protein
METICAKEKKKKNLKFKNQISKIWIDGVKKKTANRNAGAYRNSSTKSISCC